jgi:hypothetical protein
LLPCGHMYQSNDKNKKQRGYLLFLDAFHPVMPTRKVITRKKIKNRSLHRVVTIKPLLLVAAVILDVGVSSKRPRSESRSGIVGLTWWMVSINLLLDHDRVLRLGVRVDVETALAAQVAA